jgi:hypothetical protein
MISLSMQIAGVAATIAFAAAAALAAKKAAL